MLESDFGHREEKLKDQVDIIIALLLTQLIKTPKSVSTYVYFQSIIFCYWIFKKSYIAIDAIEIILYY